MSHEFTFEVAVAALGRYQTRGWRLGLDRMQEFLKRLGLQDKLGQKGGPQYVHVAGTNGKGSVTAYVQHLLVAQGFVTGATYSPYVYDVRERVQLGLDLISKEDFARLTERLLPVAEEMDKTEFGGPTEFEMKTALGFLYWTEKECDWVALEVGLGGRLDATNVVTPACSVIVNIGLDHTAILGETLRAIAIEKAGIVKPGVPVVIGDLPEEALHAVLEVAEKNSAPALVFGRDIRFADGQVSTPFGDFGGIVPGIKGAAQGHNAALAVAAVGVAGALRDKGTVASAINGTRLPGRFEAVRAHGRTFILDGAHNPDAARNLVKTLRQEIGGGRLRLVTGRIEGHPSAPFFAELRDVVGDAYVARIAFHRACDPGQVIDESRAYLTNPRAFRTVEEALSEAIADSKEGETILVTGSFYLVGEAGNLLRS